MTARSKVNTMFNGLISAVKNRICALLGTCRLEGDMPDGWCGGGISRVGL